MGVTADVNDLSQEGKNGEGEARGSCLTQHTGRELASDQGTDSS